MNAVAEPDWTIAAFEAGDIDAAAFDHESHIYLAWLYVREYRLTEAISRFTDALRRLTIKLGVPGKYHDTISWFYLLLIAERAQQSSDDSWFAFRRDNNDLFGKDANILDRYYSADLLWSDDARKAFFLPDLVTR